jgi:hypothetical protein
MNENNFDKTETASTKTAESRQVEFLVSKPFLHLTLKKKWFDLISEGKKKIEYREMKDYWITRLIGNAYKYDNILFRNGYRKDSPKMIVEIREILARTGEQLKEQNLLPQNGEQLDLTKDFIIIKLGNVITKAC